MAVLWRVCTAWANSSMDDRVDCHRSKHDEEANDHQACQSRPPVCPQPNICSLVQPEWPNIAMEHGGACVIWSARQAFLPVRRRAVALKLHWSLLSWSHSLFDGLSSFSFSLLFFYSFNLLIFYSFTLLLFLFLFLFGYELLHSCKHRDCHICPGQESNLGGRCLFVIH